MPVPSHSPLVTLTATDLRRERGTQTVLAGISVTVGPGERVGVIGANGAGKSTLLRILSGLERPDAGKVELSPPRATIGYFPQERRHPTASSVGSYLRDVTGVAAAEATLVAAADRLASGDRSAPSDYGDALERWDRLGAADFDSRLEAVLTELGSGPEVLERQMGSLSGGEATRVDLAAVLMSRFDLTLLDEPTNNLDFDGLAWLERFVEAQPSGLVIVSHDRAFLERTITTVLELDERTHEAALFRGGWDAYVEERATARRHAEERFARYETRRQSLLQRATRERQWATKGVVREKQAPRDPDRTQRGFRLDRTEALAARARRTDRALQRLEPEEKPWEGWELRYTIAETSRSGAVVAELSAAVVGRGQFRLGPTDLIVGYGDRWAVTGPNGSGKTTLLEALLGRLPLASGRRWLGPSVVVGELGQDRGGLGGDRALLDAFQRRSRLDVAAARSLLAKFGLGPTHLARAVGTLSPGERTRADLALFQAVGVNFLVLDEPTNHLDLPAIEQLELALERYQGTLVVVTHDRHLLSGLRLSGHLELDRPRPSAGEGRKPGPPRADR
jgi:ATPase subunit of ABC transporter with duplicated ATPase domains